MIEKIKTYMIETKTELKKVTWPTWEELKASTRVVIVASIVITIFIGLVDQVLSQIVRLIFS